MTPRRESLSPRRFFLVCSANNLRFGEKLHAPAAAFPADAALLHAAERRPQVVAEKMSVNPHHADPERRRNTLAARAVFRPDTPRKPVVGIIPEGDRFFLVFKRQYRENGAEYLIAENAHSRVHIHKD